MRDWSFLYCSSIQKSCDKYKIFQTWQRITIAPLWNDSRKFKIDNFLTITQMHKMASLSAYLTSHSRNYLNIGGTILSFPAKYLLNSLSLVSGWWEQDYPWQRKYCYLSANTALNTRTEKKNLSQLKVTGRVFGDISSWYFFVILSFRRWNIIPFNPVPRRPVPCNCQYYWNPLNLATLSLALFS